MPTTPPDALPLRHVSIRVPWHDRGWDGSICAAPKLNGSCVRLERIGRERRDEMEEKLAGRSIEGLPESQWPCCIPERSAFMAPFEYVRTAEHPYYAPGSSTHGHLAPTPLRHPPYSAPAVPFAWVRKDNMQKYAKLFGADVREEWEPRLDFESGWVQDVRNHRALLDCFFGHLKPERSLCFFYAKQVPFAEEHRRVLVGVGRVLSVGPSTEYKYSGPGPIRSLLWEHMVSHSIRPHFTDGFLMPYHAALQAAEAGADFEPGSIAAPAPEDRIAEFSYASEHVTNDGAIAALLSMAGALNIAKTRLIGPWDQCISWIDNQLAELWKMRGPCPGLGATLSAFGLELGTMIARDLESKVGENEDPWPLVDKMLRDPGEVLPAPLAKQVGATLRDTWKVLPQERRDLLYLLSRFELTPDQAELLFVREEREKRGIQVEDGAILDNPYLVYELTRETEAPVSVWTADRGVFPVSVVRDRHPLPPRSALDAGTDRRRVRALTVDRLERASVAGHTLLAERDIVTQVRELALDPPCPVTGDIMIAVEPAFAGAVVPARLADGSRAHQLQRLARMGGVIRTAINKRAMGRRHEVDADWAALLEARLGTSPGGVSETEARAREEKVAALAELASSRVSVLIGPAGTGKTTLLATLCSQDDIAAGGVLLLAPTGKARVRMEQAAPGANLTAYTLAQFLYRTGRFDGRTQTYRLSDRPGESTAQTVIVDEASMLTEDMLAALLDALRGVQRLILVGDPDQLPPIGAGRPFVDIVARLKPENVHASFPRVGSGYAELTIRLRQAGDDRTDLQLAEWFSGRPVEPGEDSVFEAAAGKTPSPHLEFVRWDTPEEFQGRLGEVLVKELELRDLDDRFTFGQKLGGVVSGEYVYFNRGVAAAHAEDWQILSPVRGQGYGVTAINRLIHRQFRNRTVEAARVRGYRRKLAPPKGNEEIVYGDKVINVVNHRRKKVYPEEGAASYVSNGEIGIVVGAMKTKYMKFLPEELEVEFSSQPGYKYSYFDYDFGDDREPRLELAYALTVHKAQGSEFGQVILVVPNPSAMLSRELLYTALTRQKERVVLLHQGDRHELRRYASDAFSDTARRLTNLFRDPSPVEVQGRFLEERLIHRTLKGIPVRSKSELIVADRLTDNRIEYLYEEPLKFPGEEPKYPDFTIIDDASGITYYWEHCGLLFDPAYRARWEAKLAWYRDHGILPHEEGGGPKGTLIVTHDDERGGLSSADIQGVIKEVMGHG